MQYHGKAAPSEGRVKAPENRSVAPKGPKAPFEKPWLTTCLQNLIFTQLFPQKICVYHCIMQQWRAQKIFMAVSFSGMRWSFVFDVRCL